MKFFCITIIVFELILTSCHKSISEENEMEVINISLKETENKLKLSSIVKQNSWITLETTDSCLIGRIDKIKTTKDFIFVLDKFSTRSLYVFNRKGEFLNSIGTNGKGPGEFTFPFDFTIDENRKLVFILDNGNRVLHYTYNGSYIESKNLISFTASSLEKTDKGFAFISGDRDDNLILTDSDFVRKNSYFPYVNRFVDKTIIHPIQEFNFNYFYRRNLCDTVFFIKEFAISPNTYINFGSKSFSLIHNQEIIENDIEKWLRNYCILRHYYETQTHIYIVFIYENNPYINVYSKQNEKSILYDYKTYINDISYDQKSSYVVGIDEFSNSFVCIVEPYNLIDSIKRVIEQSDKEEESYNEVLTITQKLTNTSNPILLLLEFNDFDESK